MLTADVNRLKSLIKNGLMHDNGMPVDGKDLENIIKMYNPIMPRIETEEIQRDGEIKKFSKLDFSLTREQILKILKENKLV